MEKGKLQVIAEKIASTVRVLELLELEYKVSAPKRLRDKGNKSPRVVLVDIGDRAPLRVYNSAGGHTWANRPNGKPIAEVGSVEHLYDYLSTQRSHRRRRRLRAQRT